MPRRILRSILKAMPKPGSADNSRSDNPDRELQVATCALLLDVAHADNEFSPEEERKIEALMRAHFGLSEEAFQEIKKLSEKQLQGSIDLWQFARTIKEQYSRPEKVKIIEMVWSVIYTDNTLDAHEDYLVRKLTSLLNIDHKTMIDLKLKIKKRAGEEDASA